MKGLTPYQFEILQIVRAGTEDGLVDFDQLLNKLSWQPSKESAQFTIRAICAKGLLKKAEVLQLRRGRKRVCYQLTAEGEAYLDPRKPLELPREREEMPFLGCEVDPGVSEKISLDLVSDVPKTELSLPEIPSFELLE